MYVYAGIDESGYGPLLGPLVIARSVFIVEQQDPGSPPPCLWSRLSGVLCRTVRNSISGGPNSRVAINDSKVLYKPGTGLRHLERGLLALLPAPAGVPGRLAELLESIALDRESTSSFRPWYRDSSGGPTLPVRASAVELEKLRRLFHFEAERAGVKLEELRAAVVFEDRFNELVGQSGGKARCAWRFVAAHLAAIWESFGTLGPYVAVDRQGGRKRYGPLLAGLFAGTSIEVLQETASISSYRLDGQGRRMHVEVRVESEREHLPVAYASMAAKYLRELLMMRYQAYWRGVAPEVRPTAGYYADGRRFLLEIEPYAARLGYPRELLARCC